MSMHLYLAKLSPARLAAVFEAPSIIGALFFDADSVAQEGFDRAVDEFVVDYRAIGTVAEAMAGRTALEEQASWIPKAVGGIGATLEFDFCYGPAFYLHPHEVKTIAAGLLEEGWGFGGKDVGDLGIYGFFALAVKEGKAIVGGVN